MMLRAHGFYPDYLRIVFKYHSNYTSENMAGKILYIVKRRKKPTCLIQKKSIFNSSIKEKRKLENII